MSTTPEQVAQAAATAAANAVTNALAPTTPTGTTTATAAATATAPTTQTYRPLSSTHVLVTLEIIFALVMLTLFDGLTGGALIGPEPLAAVWIVVVPTCSWFLLTMDLTPTSIVMNTTAPTPTPFASSTSITYAPALSLTHVLVTLSVITGLILLAFFAYWFGVNIISGDYIAAVYIVALPVSSYFIASIQVTPSSITETTAKP